MPKEKLKTFIKKVFNLLVSIPIKKILSLIFITPFRKFFSFITSWWYALAVIFFLIVFLYYPIGGYLIHNIDTSTNPQISAEPDSSQTVNTMTYIIDREVNQKFWTPNLPFFFPSYFLDDMPNFQLGMLASLASFSQIFADRIDPKTDDINKGKLVEAAELLQYPGTIWIFSPDNKLTPAPSSNSKYRKALKLLKKYDHALNKNIELFYQNPNDLSAFLRRVNYELAKSSKELEDHIRENAKNWMDSKADNVFFYHQGKIYAFYLLLKALGDDYQEVIVKNNLYAAWVHVLKSLELDSQINPLIIRDGEFNSLNAPNHLAYLNVYSLRAQNTIIRINNILERDALGQTYAN